MKLSSRLVPPCLRFVSICFLAVVVFSATADARSIHSGKEEPALGHQRITQEEISEGRLSLQAIRSAGRRVFATPFNALDGLGDGPMDPSDPSEFGGRPTLQNNGMFLRMNGLDSQTCLECHNVLSSATFPNRFAEGGGGGVAANAMPGMLLPDIADQERNGFAATQGRFINPPFVFGAGGIELLAKEMTMELQQILRRAEASPERTHALRTKGIDFGEIRCTGPGQCDTSKIEGIDADLVVRPFGRKGEFSTIRAFDVGALQFHHGMQPVEVVGEDVDADGDGVANEVLVGEVSALHIFLATLKRPRAERLRGHEKQGAKLFEELGCADCHTPELSTNTRRLDFNFPEVENDPSANSFYSVDLSRAPVNFRPARGGGIRVPLYADLKRHNMGPDLAEATGSALDPFFTTARLWGVADSAPYMHDGRASTLTEAILMHGGEGQAAADAFASMREQEREALIAFLQTLRTPRITHADLNRFDRTRR